MCTEGFLIVRDTPRSRRIAPDLINRDLTPLPSGLGNNYYNLPEGSTEIQDLIEHKDMSFSIGNIFKACYRLGQKTNTTRLYDLEKIKWFVEREIQLEKKKIMI